VVSPGASILRCASALRPYFAFAVSIVQ
jgi:hypothetical protein